MAHHDHPELQPVDDDRWPIAGCLAVLLIAFASLVLIVLGAWKAAELVLPALGVAA